MNTFRNRQVISVDAVDSTNAFASKLLTQQALPEGSVIVAGQQTSGRGQFGAQWWSEPEKSLTCSIVLTPVFLRPAELFLLNMAASNAVSQALGDLMKHPTHIKWPNDIVCDDSKLSGMLIESTISSGELRHSIVGIGVNVNQTSFPDFLPGAKSMKQVTGVDFNLHQLVESLVTALEQEYDLLQSDRLAVQNRYHDRLWGLGRSRLFSKADETFTATVTGVSPEGRLEVDMEGGMRQSFAVKEVVFAV